MLTPCVSSLEIDRISGFSWLRGLGVQCKSDGSQQAQTETQTQTLGIGMCAVNWYTI